MRQPLASGGRSCVNPDLLEYRIMLRWAVTKKGDGWVIPVSILSSSPGMHLGLRKSHLQNACTCWLPNLENHLNALDLIGSKGSIWAEGGCRKCSDTPFSELSVWDWAIENDVGLNAVSREEKLEEESGLHKASGRFWGPGDVNECHVFRHWNSKPLSVWPCGYPDQKQCVFSYLVIAKVLQI